MTDLLPSPITPPMPSLAAAAGAVASLLAPRDVAAAPAVAGDAGPGRFAVTLSAFIAAQTVAGGAAPPLAARQAVADRGKALPAAPAEPDDATTSDPPADATPFVMPWMPVPGIPPPPPPVATDSAATGAALDDDATSRSVSPDSNGRVGTDRPATGETIDAAPQDAVVELPIDRASPVPPQALLARGADPAGPTPAAPPVTGAPHEASARRGRGDDAPDRDAPNNVVPPPRDLQVSRIGAAPRPAGQVFAVALAAAGVRQDRPPRAAPGSDDTMPAAPLPAALATSDRPVVQPVADAAAPSIDLTQDDGLQRMIDRIEILRDAAGATAEARDTRIRLVPDALGAIDVAVRRDGDHLHVRFTAEHDATRALIAEAQPRLIELAAARGVRIAGSSIESGTAGSGGGGASLPQPRPAPPRRPAAVSPDRGIGLSPDHRLA